MSPNSSPQISLLQVKLPFPLLRSHSYTIVDYSAHQVFLHVTHSSSAIKNGNIYKSDSEGLRFSLIAKNVVRDEYGFCDFVNVHGMKSSYLINVYEEKSIKMAEIELETEADIDSKLEVLNKVLKKQSLITFDRGASWYPLSPVTEGCKADPHCSLHLN